MKKEKGVNKMSDDRNVDNGEIKCKSPSLSACLFVILLLVLIMGITSFLVAEVKMLTTPLNGTVTENETHIVESQYVSFDIVEVGDTYNIYVDRDTEILYIELKANGYSSALTALMKADGTPKKLSDY